MRRSLLRAVLAGPLLAAPLFAQSRAVTAADYARAERFLAFNTANLVARTGVQPTWLPDGRFTYRVRLPDGSSPLVVVDPAKGTKTDAFIRDWNLWVRDVVSNKETQVTTDGVKDFGYATDNAGWVHSDRAILTWSPDSKKLATFQQDQRNVGEMYLVKTKVGHPELSAWKYPLPGDSVVSMIHRVIVDLSAAAPKVVRFKMPADQHRSSVCDHISCGGSQLSDVEWYADGSKLAFLSNSRDHKIATLRIAGFVRVTHGAEEEFNAMTLASDTFAQYAFTLGEAVDCADHAADCAELAAKPIEVIAAWRKRAAQLRQHLASR